ncbi:hypothetical protein D1164_08205 [Mariniphaga sediminis]|jgi:hypothetical protein|uniref:WxL domain-containing protein n=3 Tax=Mariniphaga sediminis TaxID=1628158 RepID=A0A399D1W1_9BACT|nr:hypothetical protein [Mariniphaga sediminis]RIH65639.1 hypothetical protein D1164_08205 [Mariniphaga sediminis]
MKKLSVIIATVLFSFGAANAVVPTGDDTNEASHDVAISIPTIALVDVEGSDGNEAGTINLTPDVSALEAGAAVDFGSATNNSLWLNYTSIIGSDQDERSITAELTGTLPAGVSLKLTAGTVSTGNGNRGSSAGEISLTSSAQDLVTGIGSCYTESGYEKGHQLTYQLDMNNDSYADLASGSYDVTVIYTITGDDED